MRVFIAHSKSDDDAMLERVRDRIAEDFMREVGDVGVQLGRDDFTRRAKAYASWDEWEASIVDGTDLSDGQPLYDMIVVIGCKGLGKSTARVASYAKFKGKKVLSIDPDSMQYSEVIDVYADDVNDWKHGFAVEVSSG